MWNPLKKRDLQTEFNEIIKNVIAPYMKNLGFRKKSLNFHKQLDELTQVCNIQKSKWNSKENISFTFNIGFFNLDIFSAIHINQTPPKIPKIYDCFINFRLGDIVHKHDYWYELDKKNKFDTLENELRNDCETYLIPLFNETLSIASLEALYNQYNFIDMMIDDLSKFVWFIKLGKDKIATRLIKETYAKALIPKEDISTINYPDGRIERKVSKPYINEVYIRRIESIARQYNINLK